MGLIDKNDRSTGVGEKESREGIQGALQEERTSLKQDAQGELQRGGDTADHRDERNPVVRGQCVVELALLELNEAWEGRYTTICGTFCFFCSCYLKKVSSTCNSVPTMAGGSEAERHGTAGSA